MYRIDGFLPVYKKHGKLSAIKADKYLFEITPFTVWFGNIKRMMFVNARVNIALYYYIDLSGETLNSWYSLNWEDYSGIERIKLKDLINHIGGEK